MPFLKYLWQIIGQNDPQDQKVHNSKHSKWCIRCKRCKHLVWMLVDQFAKMFFGPSKLCTRDLPVRPVAPELNDSTRITSIFIKFPLRATSYHLTQCFSSEALWVVKKAARIVEAHNSRMTCRMSSNPPPFQCVDRRIWSQMRIGI